MASEWAPASNRLTILQQACKKHIDIPQRPFGDIAAISANADVFSRRLNIIHKTHILPQIAQISQTNTAKLYYFAEKFVWIIGVIGGRLCKSRRDIGD